MRTLLLSFVLIALIVAVGNTSSAQVKKNNIKPVAVPGNGTKSSINVFKAQIVQKKIDGFTPFEIQKDMYAIIGNHENYEFGLFRFDSPNKRILITKDDKLVHNPIGFSKTKVYMGDSFQETTTVSVTDGTSEGTKTLLDLKGEKAFNINRDEYTSDSKGRLFLFDNEHGQILCIDGDNVLVVYKNDPENRRSKDIDNRIKVIGENLYFWTSPKASFSSQQKIIETVYKFNSKNQLVKLLDVSDGIGYISKAGNRVLCRVQEGSIEIDKIENSPNSITNEYYSTIYTRSDLLDYKSEYKGKIFNVAKDVKTGFYELYIGDGLKSTPLTINGMGRNIKIDDISSVPVSIYSCLTFKNKAYLYITSFQGSFWIITDGTLQNTIVVDSLLGESKVMYANYSNNHIVIVDRINRRLLVSDSTRKNVNTVTNEASLNDAPFINSNGILYFIKDQDVKGPHAPSEKSLWYVDLKDAKEFNTETAAVEPSEKILAKGVWNGTANEKYKGGQKMHFKVKNRNVLGAQITINSNRDGSRSLLIPPLATMDIEFTVFAEEPIDWTFDVSTSSDAFIVTWELFSTWVPRR